MIRFTQFLIAFLLLVSNLSAQQQQSPLPELPSDIPKNAVIRMLLTDATPSGQDAIWQSADGAIHEFFQFNDRGRGPKIYTPYRLDANGLILSEESNGVDYMKSPVEEHFSLVDGKAAWKNQAEDEKQAGANGKFFIDLNGGTESGAILARALLNPKNNGTLPVLPSGAATIRKLQCWDRARARRCTGGGLPSSPFRYAKWVHNSTLATFPEAPDNPGRPNFSGPVWNLGLSSMSLPRRREV